MKQRWNLFCLFTRWSFFRILAVLVLVMCLEAVSFYVTFEKALEGECAVALWSILENSKVKEISLVGFLMVTLLLLRAGRDYSGKSEYTFLRLGVPCRTVFFCQAAFNSLAYLFFWLIQMFMAAGLSFWYRSMAEASWITNQTIFLQFYRSDFLISVLPLEQAGIWIRNVMLCITLGIAAAHEPFCQRRKKISVAIYITAALTAALFYQRVGAQAEYILWVVNGITTFLTVMFVCLEEEKICLK